MARWTQPNPTQIPKLGIQPPYSLSSISLLFPGVISATTGLSQWDLPLVAGDSVQWLTSL